ncbi:tRNA-intron lyase [Candidatus Micrarchaeota archaeon]|nr:tRNA-intron lyase [Candidatus Micrarchaeota archaeon]
MATLLKDKIIENDPETISYLVERGFGELHRDTLLLLSPVEALYLSENKKIDIIQKGKKIKFPKLLDILSPKDKDLGNRYLVFKDLRGKGYIARTGLKYGSHFRVYTKGIRVGEGHSTWLIHVVPENYHTSIYELSRAIRLAHSVRKQMIFAIVDSEGDITYYELERITP